MPDVHKKKLTNFESEVRAICSKFNTPIRTRATNSDRASDPDGNVHMKRFYLKGLALVPDSRIDEMVEELERVHTEMRDYVRNEIAADMDTFRQEVREKLSPEAYEQARRHIPNANELLSKTGVEWLPIPIALGNTEVRDQLRGKMNEFYDAIAESVFSEPREEVAATITAFEELIQRDGQVTTRSLEPCRRAFEKLRSFQNLGDAELDRLISELELQLQEEGLLENLRAARSSDHTSVASVAANNGLSQALRNVRETASTEAESFQRHGRMSRGLVFNGGNDGQNEDENQSVEEEVPIQ
jgi:DNA-directed RNA polymerase subunit F